MDLFAAYIKQRRRGIMAAILFFCIFVITFSLYRLPVKAVLYPVILCTALGIIFTIMDFSRVRKKHRLLAEIRGITDLVTQNIPDVDGIEDEDYQNILTMFRNEHTKMMSDNQNMYREMVDYYTIWAHQIKTPIASMRLTLQNEDTALSRRLNNDLFRIEQYVEMVMTFLRLNSESSDYLIRECELDKLVRQSVKKFAGEFISRKLSLIYEPLNTTVITDEKWLSFVLEQLLSNALKYTPAGSITISMLSEKRLCIKDTGIGIAAEDLPRIFERGYTGYNGREDKRASGIGLYLCRIICAKLGHGIKAESKVDQGTSIIIEFVTEGLEVE